VHFKTQALYNKRSDKGHRVKNENKKISVVKRTNIKKKKSEEPCACWLQPTKNNNTSQL